MRGAFGTLHGPPFHQHHKNVVAHSPGQSGSRLPQKENTGVASVIWRPRYSGIYPSRIPCG